MPHPSRKYKVSKLRTKHQTALDEKFGKTEYKLLDKEYPGSGKPTRIKHSCGHVFTVCSGNMLYGVTTCDRCKAEKNSIQRLKTYKKKVKQWRGSDYDCLEYLGDAKQNTYKHRVCGKTWQTTSASFKLSKNCPHCDGQSGWRLTQAQFDARVLKHHGKSYKVTTPYTSSEQLLNVVHKKCKHEYTIKADYFRAGHGSCPRCCPDPTKLKTLEQHNLEIQQSRGNKKYVCLKYYGGHNRSNQYTHLVCGHKWMTSATSFLASKGCPHCDGKFGTKNYILSKEDINKRITHYHGTEYKLLTDHTHVHKDIKVKHKCGNKYAVRSETFINGGGKCDVCYPGTHNAVIKKVVVSRRQFRLQGHEPEALKLLLKKYKPSQIIDSKMKNRLLIYYKYNGQSRKYYPDFYIPHRNLIVEVKSFATLGLVRDTYIFFGENLFERNQRKARACIRQGYRFKLMVWNGKHKVSIPINWIDLSKHELAQQLGVAT